MEKFSIDNPIFKDESKAREWLEFIRWPDGVTCAHCGHSETIYHLNGSAHRPGLYKCGQCRKQFSVTVGTLFERSHVPLHKWLLTVHLLCASKKGHSSHQIHRMIGVTYKTAWFMTHRIREAMRDPKFTRMLGGGGKVVEADETFWGNKRKGVRGYNHKEKIFSLIERGGNVISFHVPTVSSDTLRPIMSLMIDRKTDVMTDDFRAYKGAEIEFASHGAVKHSKGEYVRGKIHTNTIENYFSILKRGLSGVYQHVSGHHLRRYIGEFDFRYNHRKLSDIERTAMALRGIEGKRVLYTMS